MFWPNNAKLVFLYFIYVFFISIILQLTQSCIAFFHNLEDKLLQCFLRWLNFPGGIYSVDEFRRIYKGGL